MSVTNGGCLVDPFYENPAHDPTHLRRLRVLKTKGVATTKICPYQRTGTQLQRPIGKGSFGLVELVKEVATDRVYALKIMHKEAMIKNSQEAHLKCERDVLVEFAKTESPWIVPLIQSFQDNENLYLMMSFMEGGDFLGLLLREEVLPEDACRFYIAEMICAVEEVHSKGWIHRDLKPDNFLIDGNGHLKLSDFGLAFSKNWAHQMSYYSCTRMETCGCEHLDIDLRGDEMDKPDGASSSTNPFKTEIQGYHATPGPFQNNFMHSLRRRPSPNGSFDPARLQQRMNSAHEPIYTSINELNNASWRRDNAKSCVGTSQYMAPEVIAGEDYDFACDWWSIGCILYECLYGSTPFYDRSRDRVKRKVLAWQRYYDPPRRERIQRPHTTSPIPLPPVSDLAKNFLRGLITEKKDRYTCNTLKAHPWFNEMHDLDWNVLIYQRAPWVPEPRRSEDIACYFEPTDQIGPMEDKNKRPRDKILRDSNCKDQAMQIRKETAFLGYTFRKSDFVGWGSSHAVEVDPVDMLGGALSLDQMEGMTPVKPLEWMDVANGVLVRAIRCQDPAPVTLSAF
jgi:serine/threonine protein kinase